MEVQTKPNSKTEFAEQGLRVKIVATIHAPRERVIALFRDFKHWNMVFDETISDTHLVREEGGEQYIEVYHRTAGKVLNILRRLWANEFELEEFKPHYHAVFLNRFETVHDGTRYILEADVALKGFLTLAKPFAKIFVRKKIMRHLLQPLKSHAEQDGS